MIYLYGYLGAGVLVLAMVFGSKWLAGKGESELLLDLLEAQNPKRKNLWYRIRADFLAPVLTALAIVVLWPVAVFMKAKELLVNKPDGDTSHYAQREFAVQRDDLKERLSIAEIEVHEYVTDPLKAVPQLPFGHLYTAWKAFLDNMGADDAVWSFSTHWTNWAGCKELRAGYVLVRDDVVGAHFLTVRKNIEGL